MAGASTSADGGRAASWLRRARDRMFSRNVTPAVREASAMNASNPVRFRLAAPAPPSASDSDSDSDGDAMVLARSASESDDNAGGADNAGEATNARAEATNSGAFVTRFRMSAPAHFDESDDDAVAPIASDGASAPPRTARDEVRGFRMSAARPRDSDDDDETRDVDGVARIEGRRQVAPAVRPLGVVVRIRGRGVERARAVAASTYGLQAIDRFWEERVQSTLYDRIPLPCTMARAIVVDEGGRSNVMTSEETLEERSIEVGTWQTRSLVPIDPWPRSVDGFEEEIFAAIGRIEDPPEAKGAKVMKFTKRKRELEGELRRYRCRCYPTAAQIRTAPVSEAKKSILTS